MRFPILSLLIFLLPLLRFSAALTQRTTTNSSSMKARMVLEKAGISSFFQATKNTDLKKRCRCWRKF